jgi:hypothetical protein
LKTDKLVASVVFILIVLLSLSSCQPNTPLISQTVAMTPSITVRTQPMYTISPGMTPSPTGTPSQPLSDSTEPASCLQPSDDYTIITINGHKLNQRTYDMLSYATELYQGSIDITGSAITQGSYTVAVPESFRTHSGGGAVDLSVLAPGTFDVLYDEIDPLIYALRLAGFAAWFRDFNEVYKGSPVHIHAIAIGDRELSLAARDQLAGPYGYFWGYDGLPRDNGVPQRDPHGGPIMCDWMIELGYPNKTATPAP